MQLVGWFTGPADLFRVAGGEVGAAYLRVSARHVGKVREV